MKLTVIGIPVTQGNKTAYPFRKKDGKLGVSVREGKSGERHASWRTTIVDAYMARYATWPAVEAGFPQEPLDGSLVLGATFYLPRPAAAKKRLFPFTKPDLGKLIRAVEDALKGLAYTDDSRIVMYDKTRKLYADGRPPGVDIVIRPATEADL